MFSHVQSCLLTIFEKTVADFKRLACQTGCYARALLYNNILRRLFPFHLNSLESELLTYVVNAIWWKISKE